jgi:hypothetical protein
MLRYEYFVISYAILLANLVFYDLICVNQFVLNTQG